MSYTIPKSLLSIDTNAKTVKGQKQGFLTGILYLAPYTISGKNVCPMAKLASCDQACLYSAGRGAFNNVQQARLNKTLFFNDNRQAFMELLAHDIIKLKRKAEKLGMIPLVRLNGTSDIQWESIKFYFGADNQHVTIFELFPDIQFYDYTKIYNRDVPSNYDLTFSYSGVASFQKYAKLAIQKGLRVAVVFRKQSDIPKKYLGLQCIDGDNTDIRHLDPRGVVVALYAKGKAKKDTSGFVIDPTNRVIPIKAI